MTKVNRAQVIDEALELLDEVGLDGFSTRRLAQRLGVEQPTLYWHFRRKDDLLTAMAEAALAPQREFDLPGPEDEWQAWFVDNFRTFRRLLLQHRDGARLHAGTYPSADGLDRLRRKFAFLAESGLPAQEARLAMLAAGRFTVGSVLEEQSGTDPETPENASSIDHEQAFEAGLRFIVDGLALHSCRSAR